MLFVHNFPLGSSSIVVNQKKMDKQVAALESLVSSSSLKRFPRKSTATFTLVDKEALYGITSTEFMGQLSAQADAGKAATVKLGLRQRLKDIKLIK